MQGINEFQIVKGLEPALSCVHKFGRNSDVDAEETVWGGGGSYTGQPTGDPETVTVSSSDADDTALGDGAQTVRIEGLLTSDSEEETAEDFSLNGVGLVTSTNTWYRVYRAYVLTAGATGTNEGLITVAHSVTTANVFAAIPIGDGQTQIAAWTCPAGSEAYMMAARVRLGLNQGVAGSAVVAYQVREFGTGAWNSKNIYDVTNGSYINDLYVFPLLIPERADIRVQVRSVAQVNTGINAELTILINKI